MTLKIKDFDSNFQLTPEAQAQLTHLLTSDSFLEHIAQNIGCQQVEFTGLLFQPVPYSHATPKGMPAEFEKYYSSGEHVIINVPPNLMFKAKIFQPNRLCAIYQKIGDSQSAAGN